MEKDMNGEEVTNRREYLLAVSEAGQSRMFYPAPSR
jgi:hypothetical protein